MGCWLPGPHEDPATGANGSVLPSPHWTAEAQGCRWTREATTSLNPQLSFPLFLVLVPGPHAKSDWLSSGEMPMSWLLGSIFFPSFLPKVFPKDFISSGAPFPPFHEANENTVMRPLHQSLKAPPPSLPYPWLLAPGNHYSKVQYSYPLVS